MEKPESEDVISRIDPERREFVRRLVGLGFIAPAVASFSLSGLMARPAYAVPNSTSFVN